MRNIQRAYPSEGEDRNARAPGKSGGPHKPKSRPARVTARREHRRQKGRIGAQRMRPRQAATAMGRYRQEPTALLAPDPRAARKAVVRGMFGKMNAVRAHGGGKAPVARHHKDNAARAAEAGEVGGKSATALHFIMTEDDARAARQRPHRRGDIVRPGLIGQKPHHRQVRFELARAVC